MNNTPKMQIRYFYNTSSKKLYKVVNNKYSYMWYVTKVDWCKCATSVQNVLDGYYAGFYTLVDERNLGNYK